MFLERRPARYKNGIESLARETKRKLTQYKKNNEIQIWIETK